MTVLAFDRRRRERAGKSDRSYIKHTFAEKVVASYVNAYRVNRPDHKVLLIDGNAGDGEGVVIDSYQEDLFVSDIMSHPTPEILTNVAAQVGNAEVVLCEKDNTKRAALYQRFPDALILADHKEAPSTVRPEHRYVLWLSDPCGPRDHGVKYMRQVGNRVATDFVVILNHGCIARINSTISPLWETSRELYGNYADPQCWREHLNKRYAVLSGVIGQSNNFRFRIMVVSNYLATCCYRHPFTEVYSANGMQTVEAFKENER